MLVCMVLILLIVVLHSGNMRVFDRANTEWILRRMVVLIVRALLRMGELLSIGRIGLGWWFLL